MEDNLAVGLNIEDNYFRIFRQNPRRVLLASDIQGEWNYSCRAKISVQMKNCWENLSTIFLVFEQFPKSNLIQQRDCRSIYQEIDWFKVKQF